jgi:predicted TIM-barrel fold metal-dependent hydrolase
MPFVFDADVHVHERSADLAPFCEMPWRLALENDQTGDRWLDTPGYSPLTPLDPPLGERPEPDVHVVGDADVLRADLDRRGVDAALMITDSLIGLAASTSADYAVSIAAAYNRYLRERWIDPARGLYGAILVAPQDPEAAAEEIGRHADAPGVAAVLLSTVNVWPLWGSRLYEPIFAAASAAGLPCVLHGATVYGTVFPYQLQHFETPSARGALAQPLGAIANLTSLVTNGVLARHSGLKLLFCEAGLAWLPFLTSRLDGQYRHLKGDAAGPTAPPSTYVRERVWVTTHPLGDLASGGALARGLVDAIAPERVVFGSDWPHFDRDERSDVEALSLPARVLGENARELFRLG